MKHCKESRIKNELPVLPTKSDSWNRKTFTRH